MADPTPFVYTSLDDNYEAAIAQVAKPGTGAYHMLHDLAQTIRDLQSNLNTLEARVAALEP